MKRLTNEGCRIKKKFKNVIDRFMCSSGGCICLSNGEREYNSAKIENPTNHAQFASGLITEKSK